MRDPFRGVRAISELLFQSQLGIVLLAVFCSLIGSIILRGACALHNRIAKVAVPEPSFGNGVLVVFFAVVICGFIGVVVGTGLGAALGPERVREPSVFIAINVLGLFINFLVLTWLFTTMLPTTVGKARIIALLFVILSLAAGFVLGLAFFAVALLMGVL